MTTMLQQPFKRLNTDVVSKARDGGLEKKAGIAIEGAEVLFGIPMLAYGPYLCLGTNLSKETEIHL